MSQLNDNKFLKSIVHSVAANSDDLDRAMQEVYAQVFEGLLEAERDAFFQHDYNETPQGDNKRNGYYQSVIRNFSREISVKVPRDRLNQFAPLTLELIKHQQEKIDEMALQLYSKGMTGKDVEEVIENFFSTKCSPSKLSTIVDKFQDQRESWQQKPLDSNYYVVFIDATFVPVKRGDTVETEAFYTLLGVKEDLTREVLGVYNVPEESAQGWRDVFSDIKNRGVDNIALVVADGLAKLAQTTKQEFKGVQVQHCVVHKKRNIMNLIRNEDKKEMARDLDYVFDLQQDETIQSGLARLDKFINKWKDTYPSIENKFSMEEKRNLFTYLNFPKSVRSMIYTTNWIERLHKEIKKVTKNSMSFPNPDSALNAIYLKIKDMEQTTYSHPVTKLKPAKDKFKKIIDNMNKEKTDKD